MYAILFNNYKASSLILKKIYVIAALEVESFKTRLIDAQITQATMKTVNTTVSYLILILNIDFRHTYYFRFK